MGKFIYFDQKTVQTVVSKRKMTIVFCCYNTDVLHPTLTTVPLTDNATNEKPPEKRSVNRVFI